MDKTLVKLCVKWPLEKVNVFSKCSPTYILYAPQVQFNFISYNIYIPTHPAFCFQYMDSRLSDYSISILSL